MDMCRLSFNGITDRLFFKWPNATYKLGAISLLWVLGIGYGIIMIYNYDNSAYNRLIDANIRLIIAFICVYYSMSNLYWEMAASKDNKHN